MHWRVPFIEGLSEISLVANQEVSEENAEVKPS